MSQPELLESKIIDWAATRLDEAVLDPRDGYYPFEIIAEAFEKGIEHKEKNLKERMREKYFDNAKALVKMVNEALLGLKEKNIQPTKLFLSLAIHESKLMLAVDQETYINNDFIDEAYSLSSKTKIHAFDLGISLTFGFLCDSDFLNIESLKSDGFGIALDLSNNTPLYLV